MGERQCPARSGGLITWTSATLLLAREHFVLLVRVVVARLAADHDVVAEVRIEAERCAAVYNYLRRLFI